jgi:hypothetical protein
MGNSGAHPGDDGLEEVSEDEAADLLEFTEQFLDLVFVVTAKVESRLMERRRQASSS